MLAILAQNAQPANPLGGLLFIVPLGLIFYFMLIRPQNQRRRAQMELQAAVQVGDEIVTTAGIYGTITEIDDDYGIVSLEVAPGIEIRIARAAVATRLMDDEEELEDEDEVEGAEPGS
jgi:preprotein translocase subunit YajC